ncbi:MAG: NADH dehydrogenase FAD-containing subunit [Planctomycetes bacterium]|nr:NADH dehydrogenase FAD-containing subunit [Planctomycetota bacterium]
MALEIETVSPETIATMEQRIEELEKKQKNTADVNALSMVVFSGELDKLLAAFVIATGAAACGMRVSMFFTFWGAAALKKSGPQAKGKSIVERMFGCLLPGGLGKRKLSKLEMLGVGRQLMTREMAKKNVASLPELIETAKELGVGINICQMSMSLMGIQAEELIDYPGMGYCGVANLVEQSSSSNTTMFI